MMHSDRSLKRVEALSVWMALFIGLEDLKSLFLLGGIKLFIKRENCGIIIFPDRIPIAYLMTFNPKGYNAYGRHFEIQRGKNEANHDQT